MSACPQLIDTEFPATLSVVEAATAFGRAAMKGKRGNISISDLELEIATRGREFMRTLLEETLQGMPDAEAILGIEGEDGVERMHARERERIVRTRFGLIRYTRTGFSAKESDSIMPKDAALNMPSTGYSFGVQRYIAEEVAKGPFQEAASSVERETGMAISTSQIQAIVRDAVVDVNEFYETKRRPRTAPKGEILVLSCDGKGAVMRKEDLREGTKELAEAPSRKLTTRQSRGEKRNAKRIATVAAVYSVAPFVRRPSDIIGELRAVHMARQRPVPNDKRVWASLEREPREVIGEACKEVARRDRLRNRDVVVVVDGAEYQLACVKAELGTHSLEGTIVLDIIHVIEYIWRAARCFFPETSPEGEAWVTAQTLEILNSRSTAVIEEISTRAASSALSDGECKTLSTVVGYIEKNRAYMKYKTYLQRGYPIATGVIEGACRHLVKDRMDLTGARWTLATAEAVLKLRSLRSSGDFDEYWEFHEEMERKRNYQSRIRSIIPKKPGLRLVEK
jgi:hypothetical protein